MGINFTFLRELGNKGPPNTSLIEALTRQLQADHLHNKQNLSNKSLLEISALIGWECSLDRYFVVKQSKNHLALNQILKQRVHPAKLTYGPAHKMALFSIHPEKSPQRMELCTIKNTLVFSLINMASQINSFSAEDLCVFSRCASLSQVVRTVDGNRWKEISIVIFMHLASTELASFLLFLTHHPRWKLGSSN